LVSSNDEKNVYFFDADTVEKSKDTVTLWIKTVLTNKTNPEDPWAAASRWKINCSKKMLQSLTTSYYDGNGRFIKSDPHPNEPALIVPDSIGDGIQKIACESKFPYDKSETKYFKLKNSDVYGFVNNYIEYQKTQIDLAPK
jgi:hypothetical protein